MAVMEGYEKAIRNGIHNGNYVFIYEDEMITICLRDGNVATAFGNHRYSITGLFN